MDFQRSFVWKGLPQASNLTQLNHDKITGQSGTALLLNAKPQERQLQLPVLDVSGVS